MLDSLIKFDIDLFLTLNSFGSPEWDHFVYFLSNNLIVAWGLFFFIPLLYAYKKFKRYYLSIFLFAGMAIGVSDAISSGILKPTFERPRPCREVSIKDKVYIPFNKTSCAGRYGFVSSHASNSFAIALFFFLMLRKYSKKWGLLLGWASMISVTRIYLAKHYPLDLIGGALVGLSCAALSYYLWTRFISWQKARSQ